MRRAVYLGSAALVAVLLWAFIPRQTPPAPNLRRVEAWEIDPDERRMRKAQDAPLTLWLRLLARQARVEMVIAEEITEVEINASLCLEDATALEAICALAVNNGLSVASKAGKLTVFVPSEKLEEWREANRKPGDPPPWLSRFLRRVDKVLSWMP